MFHRNFTDRIFTSELANNEESEMCRKMTVKDKKKHGTIINYMYKYVLQVQIIHFHQTHVQWHFWGWFFFVGTLW